MIYHRQSIFQSIDHRTRLSADPFFIIFVRRPFCQYSSYTPKVLDLCPLSSQVNNNSYDITIIGEIDGGYESSSRYRDFWNRFCFPLEKIFSCNISFRE